MHPVYLARRDPSDPSAGLAVISRDSWLKILKQNRHLPAAQKRWFIHDVIPGKKEPDCLVLEVPHDVYLDARREQSRRARNPVPRSDTLESCHPEDVYLYPVYPCAAPGTLENLEDRIFLEQLRAALRQWQPWAEDILNAYSAEMPHMTGNLAAFWHVSPQTVRRRLHLFRAFCVAFRDT